MDDDRQLLRQFTQHNSQEAFAALTARSLSRVYSTCRRELGDACLLLHWQTRQPEGRGTKRRRLIWKS
jgi:hypothetical protein